MPNKPIDMDVRAAGLACLLAASHLQRYPS
jgi:hypothetical protein